LSLSTTAARRRVATLATLLRSAAASPPPLEDPPLVSVVLATYNWSNVLRHAVRSVLWQTHRKLELIVVGDACTDDSEAVVASFADPRVRWVNLTENTGSQAGPNNRGLALASGRYIAYQGHDDVWHPKHLATLVGTLERSDADLAYTLAEVLGPPGSRIRRIAGLSPDGHREPGYWIPPCSLMHRRDLPDRVGGWGNWRELIAPVDIDFIDRVQLAGARIERVPTLTAFKFPSTARPDSYREKPSFEQAEYIRRIESERWFLVREILALTARRLSPLAERPAAVRPPAPEAGPGALTAQMRRIRGLD
jgi:glycosyltransferase involved in cell wall biosynthesis